MQFKLQHADTQSDPHDVIVAQLRDLAPRLAHDPSELDTTPAALDEASEPSLRAAPVNDNTGDIGNPAPRARSGRGVVLVLLTVCAGGVAAAAWHSYGGEAKQRLSHFVPQLLPSALVPTQNASTAQSQDTTSQIAEPSPADNGAPVQEAGTAVPATPPQPVTTAATPAATSSAAQAAPSSELAQSIETMAREISSLKQTVEQLQAGQQQLSRDVAKITEQKARGKVTAQAPKPAPSPRPQHAPTPAVASRAFTPSPPPAYSQGQTYPHGATQRDAYVPPPAPAQLPPQPGDTSAPRPPMPLR